MEYPKFYWHGNIKTKNVGELRNEISKTNLPHKQFRARKECNLIEQRTHHTNINETF